MNEKFSDKLIVVLTVIIFFLNAKLYAQCNQPLYIAFMTHLEDDWLDNNNATIFNNHKNSILLEISFFKPYGAKVNFESAPPFLNGCYNWNDNVFQLMLDSAMGVGGHSNNSDYYDSTYSLVRGLISYNQHYLGTSGGISNDTVNLNNWVDSAVAAGYNYVNGIAYSAWLQVPQSERPFQETDLDIITNKFHDPLFPDFAENIFPRRVQSAATFYADTSGPLVLISGSAGTFNKLQEGYSYCSTNSCPLDSADVDTFLTKVNQALSILDTSTGKIACVYMHVPLNLIKPQNKVYFEYLFQSLSPLQQSGKIQYASMAEIYEAFINCEQTLSLNKRELTKTVVGYPNPVSTYFIIKADEQTSFYYTIKDISGRKVAETEISSGTTKVDFSELTKGTYFIEMVYTQNNFKQTLKIIKQ